MSIANRIMIDSLEEFLAHMLALKCEAEDRLQELADCLEGHNNLEAADIFRQLQKLAAESVCEIERLAEGIELPSIPIWDYQWYCTDSPECACIDNAHYLMNSRQALELARLNSRRTRTFLLQAMNDVRIEEVQEIARQLFSHEETFIYKIEQWLAEIGDEDMPLCNDLDPPNTPE